MTVHHALVIEAAADTGIEKAKAWVQEALALSIKGNPDISIITAGHFSVEDARRVSMLASMTPVASDTKVLIIAVSRLYREAQNALLKLFEEPPRSVILLLIIPSAGLLLPTLRSRVQILEVPETHVVPPIHGSAEAFIKATGEKRSAYIKKLLASRNGGQRGTDRDEALALITGIETVAYRFSKPASLKPAMAALLADLSALRKACYEQSAPVKLILEHLALVTPQNLV